MLKAILLFLSVLTTTSAVAGEMVIEMRQCTHPEVIKRLYTDLREGEVPDPVGDWDNCEEVKEGSIGDAKFIDVFPVNDNPLQFFRLWYRESTKGEPIIILEKLAIIPNTGERI